jgi:hypothetical protein
LLNPPKQPPSRKEFGLSETTKVSKGELGAWEALINDGIEVEMPKDLVTLFTRERAYQAAKTHYDQYLNWVKTRNPARAELERLYGYDCKHGSHLIRLMLMCKEILEFGEVIVKRPDFEMLLGVKRGSMAYDPLIEMAERIEVDCEALYKTSKLQHEADHAALDALVVSITDRYLSLHG